MIFSHHSLTADLLSTSALTNPSTIEPIQAPNQTKSLLEDASQDWAPTLASLHPTIYLAASRSSGHAVIKNLVPIEHAGHTALASLHRKVLAARSCWSAHATSQK